ncbi:MAG: pyruvate kinase, partial [Alphaproteobacteria bacterium]|nr:pyruvate kinase [Alphaproteobacteria bacterium]
MRRQRNTKIVATLGPASSTPEMIEKLFVAGVDVFRLNFSHGTHEDHLKSYNAIRGLEKKCAYPIAILMDLQGPKLRVGKFKSDSIELMAGQEFRLDFVDAVGDVSRVQLPHPEIFAALRVGVDLLLDDGKIRLRVIKCGADYAQTTVMIGGILSNNKGLNVPGVSLPISSLTEKDRHDLTFGLELGMDIIALSFVQKPEDIEEAKQIIQGRAKIISKLEKPLAIEHLTTIVGLSDGIMVARGDLGVEMDPEEVPSVQKHILRACRLAGKPVIVATQMLESMIQNPSPTRAEASDVATAVYEGADAVMLSAESASGQYPLEAVSMMDRIIKRVERDPLYRSGLKALSSLPEATVADAITTAASQVANTIAACAIITYTITAAQQVKALREHPDDTYHDF